MPTIVSHGAFCTECMRAAGMPHKAECSQQRPDREQPATDEDQATSWLGRDGSPWSFVGTPMGPMIEVVKIRQNGDVIVAPHATLDDLRTAIEVLGRSYFDAVLMRGIEPADISIDVRV